MPVLVLILLLLPVAWVTLTFAHRPTGSEAAARRAAMQRHPAGRRVRPRRPAAASDATGPETASAGPETASAGPEAASTTNGIGAYISPLAAVDFSALPTIQVPPVAQRRARAAAVRRRATARPAGPDTTDPTQAATDAAWQRREDLELLYRFSEGALTGCIAHHLHRNRDEVEAHLKELLGADHGAHACTEAERHEAQDVLARLVSA